LNAIRYAAFCDDVFRAEALGIAVNQLALAGDQAVAANQGEQFEQQLSQAAVENPTLEIYTTLANFYSKGGRVSQAIQAVDGALGTIPESDPTTRQRYQDFRFTLVELQKALEAVESQPNEPELQRIVANLWLQRGQLNFALPAYQRILELKPDDYAARRNVALLLIASDQLSPATQQITLAEQLAPEADKAFWQQLGAVVNDIESGNEEQAVTQLEQLAGSANSQDIALVSALRKLAERLRGAG
jgi:tetratricopeptide (TPR) repeat protein